MCPPDDPDAPAGDAAPAGGAAAADAAPSAPAPAPAPAEDKRVKELLDAKTLADLERWFGLPSFQELGERGQRAEPPPDDPEMVARREQRDRAIAAVDPVLLERQYARAASFETMLDFDVHVDLHVDPDIGVLDHAMIEGKTAEPREVEIPEPLRDDLAECTPQAVLRDLHRPELYFDKQFEIVDMAAEQRLDIVAEVTRVMSTDWRMPDLGAPPAQEGRALLAELRAERRRDLTPVLSKFPNRRVTD